MPRFVLQAALRVERGLERIARRVERGAECIARDLKHMSVVARDGLMQDGVMAREEGRQFGGNLLRQRGAALDVGEEKGDGAGRQVIHRFFLNTEPRASIPTLPTALVPV